MVDPQLVRGVLVEDSLLVTPEEAAALLRGRPTVYALMKAGALKPIHIGRSCRLPRAKLQRYINELAPSATTHPGRPPQTSTDESGVLDSVHSGLDIS